MAARKLQQEIDKCFKQVDLGVEQFDAQYEKYEQATSASQREKQVDTLKKECKKLQRMRDQIKTWAAGNEVKDKNPLQEKRELIETKMEAFKAVEKEMKTKAFSKEGLLVSTKMDPKEKEIHDMRAFLSDMVDELGMQIEATEAEVDNLQAQAKKKKDSAKAERLSELENRTERHKWHQNKLELLMRALANEDVDVDQVRGSQEDIRHYVDNNQEVDFFEDEGIYDEFNLEEDGDRFGMGDGDDSESAHDESPESSAPPPVEPAKPPPKAKQEARRPSVQATTSATATKSPMPSLATLHSLPAATVASVSREPAIKPQPAPAPLPAKPPGETLKYASAAAAAAANDAAGIGIAPLPPPPVPLAQAAQSPAQSVHPPPQPRSAAEVKHAAPAVASPKAASAQPAQPAAARPPPASARPRSPGPAAAVPAPVPAAAASVPTPAPAQSPLTTTAQPARRKDKDEPRNLPAGLPAALPADARSRPDAAGQDHDRHAQAEAAAAPKTNGIHAAQPLAAPTPKEDDESIFHLPASLQELVDCYEDAKKHAAPPLSQEHQRLLEFSLARRPTAADAEPPTGYRPARPAIYTPPHYPQEPSHIFDNPLLYNRVDHDALFYTFYYKQGSYQQYLAAKELKSNSWRFHKQYQTWFQRHDEPAEIQEEYERGTYRFFDYESTWMNRRKADFEFKYRFLEDEL